MKPEAQLIALLEWMGARGFQPQSQICYWPGHYQNKLHELQIPAFASDERTGEVLTHIPPLTLDLMHEAWRKLDQDQKGEWWFTLATVVSGFSREEFDPHNEFCCADIASATKEQRLEALLKTIGKWEPTHSPKIATEGMTTDSPTKNS